MRIERLVGIEDVAIVTSTGDTYLVSEWPGLDEAIRQCVEEYLTEE